MDVCCRCATCLKWPAGKGCQIPHVPVLSPQYLQLRIGGQLLWHFIGNNSDLSTEDDRNMPMPGIDVPGEEAYWVASLSTGLRHMLTHPLKAWSPVEWGMPTQQALPPPLLLITAGGYAPAE